MNSIPRTRRHRRVAPQPLPGRLRLAPEHPVTTSTPRELADFTALLRSIR